MLARVLAMALCLSVCLSVCLSQVGVLVAARIELVLAWMLLSTSLTLRFKEIQSCTQIRVLPSGTVS